MSQRTQLLLKNRLSSPADTADIPLPQLVMSTPDVRSWQRLVLRLTLATYLAQILLVTVPADAAGVIVAPNAPAASHPLTDRARNGVPIVDIAAPSAGGVSNNLYNQFNVNGNGLILNNSSGNVNTKLSGWISGNPLLGVTPANLILNQVITNNPSQLLGTMEVAGQTAEVVIANPSGITCNGCGFLNTTRATLTTGVPQFGGNGSLQGFAVGQGELTIGNQGLNAANVEQLDLLARNVVVDGGNVWAQTLHVVAGANQIDYGTLQHTQQTATGATPLFAIDVRNLGGMYANEIYLVATDQGLGVNSTGRLAALQGNLLLSANGNLTLQDTYAQHSLQLNASGSTALNGLTQSGADSRINTGGTLSNAGRIDAGNGLALQSASLSNTGALIQRGVNGATLNIEGALSNSGTLYSTGQMQMSAASITDTSGTITATGPLSLQAQTLTLTGTAIQSGSTTALTATAGALQTSNTQITSTGDLTAHAAGALSNQSGNWQSGGNIALNGASIDNTGGIVHSSGTLNAATPGILSNSAGQLLAGGNATVNSASLINDHGQLASNQSTSVTAADGISNQSGVVSGVTALAVNVGSANLNNAGGSLLSGAASSITAGATANNAGTIAATGPLTITTAQFDNTGGTVNSGSTLQAATQALINQGGLIQSTGAMSINTQGQSLDNTHSGSAGGIIAGTTLSMQTGNLDNSAGTIASYGDQTITTPGNLTNTGGTIAAQGSSNSTAPAHLTLAVQGALTNSGTLYSAGQLQVNAASIADTSGTITTTGPLSLQAQSLNLAGTTIQSGGTTHLTATQGALQASNTSLTSTGDLTASTTGALSNQSGNWQSAGNIALNGTSVDNTSGIIHSSGTLNAATPGILSNSGGQLLAGGNATINSASLINDHGQIASNQATAIHALGGISNQSGTISGVTGLAINVGTASVNNAAGALLSGGSSTLTAGNTSNAVGTIAATGPLTMATAQLDNTGGTIASTAGNLTLTTEGQSLTNNNGHIQSAATAVVSTGALSNHAGLISANALTLATGSVDNTAGNIVAATALQANTQALANTGGLIQGGSSVVLNTQGQTLSNTQSGSTGGIVSGGSLTVQTGALDNTGGYLASNGNQTIATQGDFTNTGGTMTTLGGLSATVTGNLNNQSGSMAANQDVNLISNTLSNTTAQGANHAGSIAGRDVSLVAGTVANQGGSIQSAVDTVVTTSNFDNTGGTASAGQNLTVAATQLTNTGGSLLGNNIVTVNTASAAPAGTIASAGTVNLNDSGAYLNSGLLSAQGDLNITASGITNNAGATLTAGHNLTATTAGDLNNAGEISAANNTVLNVGGTLTNSGNGLINSDNLTGVNAATLNNTARIYGNWVALATTSTNNTGPGVIAARNGLQLAAQTLNNTGNAQILSLGDLTMAGSFDPYGGVMSPMASLLNASSTIQAQGNVTLLVNNLTNRNDGLVIGTNTVSTPLTHTVTSYNFWTGTSTTSVVPGQYIGNNTTLYTQTTTTPYVQSTAPAQIVAGGALTISGSGAGSVTNANSILVAGGALNIASGALNNQSASGTQTVTLTGQTAYPIYDQNSWFSGGGSYIAGYYYQPYSSSSATTIPLNTVTVVANSNTVAPLTAPSFSVSAPATASASTPTSTPATLNHTLALGQVLHATAIATQTLAANPAAIAHIPASSSLLQNAVAIADPSSVNTLAHAPPTVQQVTVPGSGTQASLVISTMLPSLVAPANELFTILPAPNANYLVETDPAFTNQQNFLSSNYFLQKLNVDPSRELKRYGDGFYEQQLINQQVMGLTGRAYLGDYTSTQAEYQALMNAGVTYAKDFDLTPGVTLSAAEMAKMTTDMVWMTTKTVTLADGTTQQVLVPQVYLAHAPGQDMTNGGSLIAGAHVAINTAQNLTNGGQIQGTSISATSGNDLVNQNGLIRGNQVLLSAGNDLFDLSGTIAGTGVNSQVDLLAGRDLNLQTQTLASSTAMSNRTSLGALATVQADNIHLQAGRDLTVQGAQVSATQDIQALAGRDINVGATTTTFNLDSTRQTGDNNNYLRQSSTTQNGSSLAAGGNVILATAGGNASLTASSVTAGHDLQIAARNVSVQAGVNSRSNDYRTGGKDYLTHTASATQSLTGGVLSAGNNLAIQAAGTPNQTGTGDIALNAAQLAAQNGQVDLQAAHDINLGTVDTTQSSYSHTYSKSSGFFSSSTTNDISAQSATAANGSSVSGNSVAMIAGNNLTVTGSSVTGAGNTPGSSQISMMAGGNLIVNAAANSESSNNTSSKSGGLFGGESNNTANQSQATAQRSQIQGSSIQMQSGGDTVLQAAKISGSNLSVNAGTIDGQVVNPNAHIMLDAAINSQSQSHASSSSGLLTQSMANSGSMQQSLQYTTISASNVPTQSPSASAVSFHATGGMTVEASSLPLNRGASSTTNEQTLTFTSIDLRQQAQQLAQQPGMGYMAQLANRDDVTWQKVQLASQKWNYSESGLSRTGAMIVAIVVAVATYGAASGLSSTMVADAGMTTTAGATGASTVAVTGAGVAGSGVAAGTVLTTTGAALSAATAAGISTLTSEAAVSLANDGGDIGKTLRDLGSRQSVKNIIAAMLTAGVGQNFGGYSSGTMAAKTAVGCAAGSITGTGCQNGVESTVITTGAAWTYNSVIGYTANAGPGNTPAVGKDYPIYTPQENGQQPANSFGNNVIGLNASGSFFSQGSSLSNGLNYIPFVNATAGLHDWFFNASPLLNSIFPLMNVPLMGVAAAFSIPASFGNSNLSYLLPQKIVNTKRGF